jgi:hypothetical protein
MDQEGSAETFNKYNNHHILRQECAIAPWPQLLNIIGLRCVYRFRHEICRSAFEHGDAGVVFLGVA